MIPGEAIDKALAAVEEIEGHYLTQYMGGSDRTLPLRSLLEAARDSNRREEEDRQARDDKARDALQAAGIGPDELAAMRTLFEAGTKGPAWTRGSDYAHVSNVNVPGWDKEAYGPLCQVFSTPDAPGLRQRRADFIAASPRIVRTLLGAVEGLMRLLGDAEGALATWKAGRAAGIEESAKYIETQCLGPDHTWTANVVRELLPKADAEEEAP